jgi:hypothetical protein
VVRGQGSGGSRGRSIISGGRVESGKMPRRGAVKTFSNFFPSVAPNKVEEPIPDTLRFRTTKESELDMKKN